MAFCIELIAAGAEQKAINQRAGGLTAVKHDYDKPSYPCID